ncbi:mucin-4-like [Rana temporaria]|uniref:mucin-4-like n=1 Tax=Rana temporaria TaxID=8407 RepID=UPI001AACF86A|nr:mucin-4-like [Rana temporaria]
MDYSACGRAGNGFPAETAADSAENCNKNSSTDAMIENGDECSELSRDGFNPHISCPTSGVQEGKQETTMAKEGIGAAMKHQIATETGIDITAQMLPSGGTQSHVHVVRTAVSETSAQQPTDVGQKNSILHHLIDPPPISVAPFFQGKPTANIAMPFSVETCSETGTSSVIMGDDLEIYENIKPTAYVTKTTIFNKLELSEDAFARKQIFGELMCDPQGTIESLAIHSEYKGDSGIGDSELRIDNTTDLYSDLETLQLNTLEQNKNYLKISKKIMKNEDLSDVYMSSPEKCQLKKCDPAEEITCMWVKHSDPNAQSPYIQRSNVKDCVSDKLYNASSLAKVWHVPRSCLPGNSCKGMPTCGTECVGKCCGEILSENLVTSKLSGPLCGPFGQPINASMSVFTSLEQQMNNQCPTPTKDHNSFDGECTEGSEGPKDLDCDLAEGYFTKVKHCEEDGIYYFKEKEQQNKPPFISVNKDIHDMGFKNTDTTHVETCSKETGVTLGRLTAQLGISSGEDNTNMSTSAEGDTNNCNSITLVKPAFHKDGELQDHITSVITIQTKGTENSKFSHKCSQLEDIKEMSNIKSVLCHSPSNMGANTELGVQTSVYTRNSTAMKNSIKTFEQNDAYSGVMNAEHHRDIELSKQRQKPCFRDSRHSSEPPFQSLTSADPPYYSTTSYDYPPYQRTSSSVYQSTVSFPDPANNNATSSTVPSYQSTDYSHDVSYQNKTSSEPVYQSMTFSDGLPYQSKPPSDNAPYQSTTSSGDPHYQSTTSFDHLPNQNTTYSADPHCQSAASFPDLVNNNKAFFPNASYQSTGVSTYPCYQSTTSLDPAYQNMTSSDNPPHQSTTSSDDPKHQRTISSDDPPHQSTTSSDDPPYQSTTFSDDPPHQRITFSNDPPHLCTTCLDPTYQNMTSSGDLAYQSTISSDDPPHQSTTSSDDPPYQSTTSSDNPPHQSTTSSDDPKHQSTISSDDPPHQSTTSSDEPPYQRTTSSDDPPHQSITSSNDPLHLCTTFLDPTYQNMTSSGDLAYQSTISSDDPPHQSTTSSDDPKHQSTISSDEPPHQSTTSSDDPPHQSITPSNDFPHLCTTFLEPTYQNMTSSGDLAYQSTVSSDDPLHQSTTSYDDPQHQSTTFYDDPQHQSTTSSDDPPHQSITSSNDPPHLCTTFLDPTYQKITSSGYLAYQSTISSDDFLHKNTTSFDDQPNQCTTSSDDPPHQSITSSNNPPHLSTSPSDDPPHQSTTSSDNPLHQSTTNSDDPPYQCTTSSDNTPHQSTSPPDDIQHQSTASSDDPPHQSTTSSDDTQHQKTTSTHDPLHRIAGSILDSYYQDPASTPDQANDRPNFSTDPPYQNTISFDPLCKNMTSSGDLPYQGTTSSEDLPHQINNVSADSICQTTISRLKLPYQSTASSPDPANDSINSFPAPFYHSTDFSSYSPSQSTTSSDPPYQSMSTFADSPCQSVTSFPDQPYQVTSSVLKSTFQFNNTSQDQSGQRENIYFDLSSQGLCNNTVTGNLCTSSSPDVTKPIQDEYGALVKKNDCAFLEELRRIFLDCQGQGLTFLDSGIVLTKNVTVDNSIALIALRDGSELGMVAPPSKLFFYYQLGKHFYITKQLSEQWYCAQDRITKVTMLMKKVPVTSNWMKQLHNFLLLPKHPRLLTPYAAISNRTGSILFLMEDKPLLGTRTLEMAPLRYEVNIPARIWEIMIFLEYCKINNVLPRNIEDSILYTPQGLWFDPSSLDNNDDLYELQKCLKTSLSLFLCRGQQEFDPCLEALHSITCHLLEEDQIHQAHFLITSHQGPFPFSLPHFPNMN